MTVETFDSNEARAHWRNLLDLAQTQDTDVVITRYNKPVVAMVSYDDYVSVQEELNRQRRIRRAQRRLDAEARATMFATEQVLAREWDTPEEDEAWKDL